MLYTCPLASHHNHKLASHLKKTNFASILMNVLLTSFQYTSGSHPYLTHEEQDASHTHTMKSTTPDGLFAR